MFKSKIYPTRYQALKARRTDPWFNGGRKFASKSAAAMC